MDIEKIRASIRSRKVQVTDHAEEEVENDGLTIREVLASVMEGEVIEDYPGDKPCPSCLILGRTSKAEPIHSVWAYDGETGFAVLVTTYRPDPTRWIEWKQRRRP